MRAGRIRLPHWSLGGDQADPAGSPEDKMRGDIQHIVDHTKMGCLCEFEVPNGMTMGMVATKEELT